MDYNKIETHCFVCECEDALKQPRGTQSHPINCGWRIMRENKGYEKGLDEIIKLCRNENPNDEQIKELIRKIKNIAMHSLVGRYDIES